jgi:hypothetical protein
VASGKTDRNLHFRAKVPAEAADTDTWSGAPENDSYRIFAYLLSGLTQQYSPVPQRGRALIELLISISIVAGLFFGWYGHKASLRIQAWGQNMNAQDRIFQEVSGERENVVGIQSGIRLAGAAGGSMNSPGHHGLPMGAASK